MDARCYDPPMDLERVKQVLAALRSEGVAYKVFGGVALNLHGLPQFTQDLDLFVAPTAENVDRLRRALDSVFHDPELAGLVAEDLLGPRPRRCRAAARAVRTRRRGGLMPLRKFRSVEEMDAGPWLPAGHPRLAAAIRGVWAFGSRTLRPRFPPGLHRHRSIEEAQATAEAWEQERFEAARARSVVGPR
jgi:hypothetical protein